MRWRGCDWLGAPCSALQAHCQYLVLASRGEDKGAEGYGQLGRRGGVVSLEACA